MKTYREATCFFLIATLSGCVGEANPDTESGQDGPQGEASAALVLQECTGDNDMSASGCFQGSSWDGSFVFDNTYAGYWWGDVRYSAAPLSPTAPKAEWDFQTSSYGEVWFSAWIPGSHATAYAEYRVYCFDPVNHALTGSLIKYIDQLQIQTSSWQTLGNVGYLAKNSFCSVTVTKALNKYKQSDLLAMDGMKMKVYQ